jgi:hypothetical protein
MSPFCSFRVGMDKQSSKHLPRSKEQKPFNPHTMMDNKNRLWRYENRADDRTKVDGKIKNPPDELIRNIKSSCH